MMMNTRGYGLACLLVGLSLAACTPTQDLTRTDALHGKALYDANCAQCHGSAGEGGAAASRGLVPSPPSLRVLSQNNSGLFPRNYVMATIDGLSRHNELTAVMPEFGAGNMGPVILVEENGLSSPIPADLIAMANYLETIQD